MGQAAKADGRVGQLIAKKYRVEQLLGEGGVGLVYRAHNTLLGRDVAIKVLRPEFVQNEELLGRFMREARAANLVRHPNVVDVLDVGLDDDGMPYIVQELLKGEDLAQLLERTEGGRIPVSKAVALMLPVVDAVAFAHAMGVVHRDLKPDNVFLATVDGGVVPKILDFGISKIAASLTEDVRITSTGISMGTPAYMSPEQIQHFGNIDARADVWALGVMLYELIAGRLPFDGETSGAMFVSICSKDPTPLESVLPGVPPGLVHVIGRCIRRDPADRYPTAAEFARDLRNLNEGREPEPTRKIALVSLPPPPIEATRAAATAGTPSLSGAQPAAASTTGGSGADTTANLRRISAETTQPEAVAPVVAAPPPPAPASRRGILIAGAAVAALAGAVVVLAATRASTRPAGPAAPPTTVSATAPPPVAVHPAATSHPLLIESSPPGAEVREDDRVLGTTPLTVTVDDQRARRFVLTAPGRAPYVIDHAAASTESRVMAALLEPTAQASGATTAQAGSTTGDAPHANGRGGRNARGRGGNAANAGGHNSATTTAATTGSGAANPGAGHAPLEIRTER